MARSSADDMNLKSQCQEAIDKGSVPGKQQVILCMRVAKTHAVWGKPTMLGRHMAKHRVLAISTKTKGPRTKAFLRVLKESNGGILEPAKIYKLKHLSKLEAVTQDPTGCTFQLGFDNLKNKSVAPPQWTMRNKDDRNRILMCILNLCKEVLGTIPKVQNLDIVEMALWAKENTTDTSSQAMPCQDGQVEESSIAAEVKSQEALERDLINQAKEEDMEELLATYLMGVREAEAFSESMKRELLALEYANVHAILEAEPTVDQVLEGLEVAIMNIEDMDEWLKIFNVKLRHMREDIESIEYRNNKLEFQSDNNVALINELDKLLELLRIPPEYEEILTVGTFEEDKMPKNIEACEWLTQAIHNLELPNIDPCYVKMRAVREKRAEFILLRCTFVHRASEFLQGYLPSVIDLMMKDKNNFSQKGNPKGPNHSDLRYKCIIYERLLQQIKHFDETCMFPLRKSYCHSLHQLLLKEIKEFGNEVRATIRAGKQGGITLEGLLRGVQASNTNDTSTTFEAYSKMITTFIPLMVDESSFFTHFMCFEVASGSNQIEMEMLNECLQELLEGIKDEFFQVIDWAYKIDELSCISMHGFTQGQKAENSEFVQKLLEELVKMISKYFCKSIHDACYLIGKHEKNIRQSLGVLPHIPRFGQLAQRMELYVHGRSRDLIDEAYTQIVKIMFQTLEDISEVEPKYKEIFLLENYAAFQNSLYELANQVPTLAKYYHQASESYEQACLKHINMVIIIHFEKLFQFARRIEELLYNNPPENVPYLLGMSKNDLRKVFKSNLGEVDKVDKTLLSMYKKLQKNLTAEELFPSLWDKCKKEFMDKYTSLLKMVQKIYPNETVFTAAEMSNLIAKF